MRVRLLESAIIILFLVMMAVTSARMPKMLMIPSVSHNVDNHTSDDPGDHKLDYTAMTEKELMVLAYDGDPYACYRLGVLYDYGANQITQNFSSALEWYRTADAYGMSQAACGIGYLYLNGCGVEQDYEVARLYFQRAAQLGDPEGYVGLGRVGLETDGEGSEIFELIKTAKDSGVPDGAYYLGYLYEKGIGTSPRGKKAYRLYKKTATLDSDDPTDNYAICASMTRLGILCMEGIGTKRDYSEALEWFEQAADRDYAMAYYYIGIMYEMGYGVSQDYGRALSYLDQAAQKNYAPALNEIGCMYFAGRGVDVNFEQAVYYQKLAAALGYEKAQVNLGYLYENGYGVQRDLSIALTYYQMAKDRGYAGAAEATARVHSLINRDR